MVKWKESFVASVWLRLPLIPLCFYYISYLKAIIQSLGNFLATDLPTLTHTRPVFARVCVDIDFIMPKECRVWIGTSLEACYWQSMEYEKSPKFCSMCQFQWHEHFECKRIFHVKPSKAEDTVLNP